MFARAITLAALVVPFVASQNASSDYLVDLGYAKYQGALNGR